MRSFATGSSGGSQFRFSSDCAPVPLTFTGMDSRASKCPVLSTGGLHDLNYQRGFWVRCLRNRNCSQALEPGFKNCSRSHTSRTPESLAAKRLSALAVPYLSGEAVSMFYN